MTERMLLPPYTAEAAVCPKCGYDQPTHEGLSLPGYAVATSYCMKLDRPPRPPNPLVELGAAPQPTEHPVIAQIAPGQEALVRVCRRCDFPWAEATVDDPDLALSRLEHLQ